MINAGDHHLFASFVVPVNRMLPHNLKLIVRLLLYCEISAFTLTPDAPFSISSPDAVPASWAAFLARGSGGSIPCGGVFGFPGPRRWWLGGVWRSGGLGGVGGLAFRVGRRGGGLGVGLVLLAR